MNQLITRLKEAEQDFEYYPTTEEIISAMVRDITRYKNGDYHKAEEESETSRGRRFSHREYRKCELSSVLDIGAGHGKVLTALEKAGFGSLYAIEKSPILCQQLDASVFIIGADFMEQSLMSKQVDMIFCNPPYSQFVAWAVKIIRESPASLVYLVIPQRWKDSQDIKDALKFRSARYKTVGDFDFENAEDRAARAKVNLIRIEMSEEKDDAFDRFFNEQFAELKAKFDAQKPEEKIEDQKNPKLEALVVGENYPERLVACYNEEMDHIQKNYDLVAKLDSDLLKEFDVTPVRILGCLKARLAGLKVTYWNQLFSNMSQVTDRLTTKKRRDMMAVLNKHGHVDFNLANIHVIIIWVLKNANVYLEQQLIETFEAMVEKANVRNYVSNTRAFVHDRWRYNEEKPTHIALEYRMVLQYMGGLEVNYSGGFRLSEPAGDFLRDLMTVAGNLGFPQATQDRRLNHWDLHPWSSAAESFGSVVGHEKTQKHGPLFEVRAYRNRNIHIRLNQDFALALNVEYGRLRGWLKSGQEAAEELNDKEAAKYFAVNVQLGQGSLPMLGYGTAPTTAITTDPEPVEFNFAEAV